MYHASPNVLPPTDRAGFRVFGGNKILCLYVLAISLVTLAEAGTNEFVPGQILVRPKAHLSESNFTKRLAIHRAFYRANLEHINVRVINVPNESVEAVLTELRNDPDIEFAERDGIARAAFVPNDSYVVSGNEWHLQKIQAPQAWDYTAGTPGSIIAILDSGINSAHPDLIGRILPGYDFVSNDSDPADDFGHGTAVAGTAVAAGNNALGVAGVAFGCVVLPVKVVDSSGYASYSCVAQGIKYAVDRGARVINLSIAGDTSSSTLQAAIDYAWSNNVVVVAAAGNNANSMPQYPAACAHVVAVSATEPDDSLAAFSSYGSFIALSAPGDNIWTTQRDLSNPYGAWRGTSFASPIVAGTAALIAAANPTLSNTQIVSILETGADDLGVFGYDTSFGFGRINAFRAMTAACSEPGAVFSAGSGTNNPPPAATNSFAVLTIQTSGVGRIIPDLNGKQLQIGSTYTLRAQPGPGQVFAGWDGVPGIAEWPILNFVMSPNLTLVAKFAASSFPATPSHYSGLMADPNGVQPESAGYVAVTIRHSGTFSGKVMVAGAHYGFVGQLNSTGDALLTLRGRLAAPLTISLHVDMTNGTDQLAGTVSDGAWTAEVAANRNVFSSRLNPAPQTGLRSFTLEQADSAPGATADGTSRISPAGNVTVRGKLGDGQRFATSSVLAKNGDLPFYLTLHRGNEVVIGWLNFPATTEPAAGGSVVWLNTGSNAFARSLQVSFSSASSR